MFHSQSRSHPPHPQIAEEREDEAEDAEAEQRNDWGARADLSLDLDPDGSSRGGDAPRSTRKGRRRSVYRWAGGRLSECVNPSLVDLVWGRLHTYLIHSCSGAAGPRSAARSPRT